MSERLCRLFIPVQCFPMFLRYVVIWVAASFFTSKLQCVYHGPFQRWSCPGVSWAVPIPYGTGFWFPWSCKTACFAFCERGIHLQAMGSYRTKVLNPPRATHEPSHPVSSVKFSTADKVIPQSLPAWAGPRNQEKPNSCYGQTHKAAVGQHLPDLQNIQRTEAIQMDMSALALPPILHEGEEKNQFLFVTHLAGSSGVSDLPRIKTDPSMQYLGSWMYSLSLWTGPTAAQRTEWQFHRTQRIHLKALLLLLLELNWQI